MTFRSDETFFVDDATASAIATLKAWGRMAEREREEEARLKRLREEEGRPHWLLGEQFAQNELEVEWNRSQTWNRVVEERRNAFYTAAATAAGQLVPVETSRVPASRVVGVVRSTPRADGLVEVEIGPINPPVFYQPPSPTELPPPRSMRMAFKPGDHAIALHRPPGRSFCEASRVQIVEDIPERTDRGAWYRWRGRIVSSDGVLGDVVACEGILHACDPIPTRERPYESPRRPRYGVGQ